MHTSQPTTRRVARATAALVTALAAFFTACSDAPTTATRAGGRGLSAALVPGPGCGLTECPSSTQPVVFASDRDGNMEIYSMKPNGSSVKRLTTNLAVDREPASSPDGSKIAFVSNRTGSYQIFVMNADGSGVVQLTNSGTINGAPHWSPTGATIAFHTNRTGPYRLYEMNADGTNAHDLLPHVYNYIHLTKPSYSPSGKQIVFLLTTETMPTYGADVDVMELATSTIRVMGQNSGHADSPAFSPDGKTLLFTRNVDDKVGRGIFSADPTIAHGVLTRLTTANDVQPTWNADGTTILFASTRAYLGTRGAKYSLYSMLPDGSSIKLVSASTLVNDLMPFWAR